MDGRTDEGKIMHNINEDKRCERRGDEDVEDAGNPGRPVDKNNKRGAREGGSKASINNGKSTRIMANRYVGGVFRRWMSKQEFRMMSRIRRRGWERDDEVGEGGVSDGRSLTQLQLRKPIRTVAICSH